jgi:SnoaL-like domain
MPDPEDPTMTDIEALAARLDRLESLDQIRQLPAKYALALDMRDWDSLVNLFVEDVGVPGKQRGRQALKHWYDGQLRHTHLATAHGAGAHVIDFEGPDLAVGVVYSRNDLETEDTWLIEMMAYLDRYERRGDRWYFQRRTPLFLYESDITDPPLGGTRKLRWPGREWVEESFHDAFPTWRAFWDREGYGDEPVAPPADLERFLDRLRRGETDAPRVNPGGGSRAAVR